MCPFKKNRKDKGIIFSQFITSYFTTFYYSHVLEVIYVYGILW